MTITPSMSGSIMSGATVWTIFWSIVSHIDSIPLLKHFISKDKVFGWVNKNKVLTITTTEVLNLSVHGITSPLGPMMAFGGTIVNAIFIFMINPLNLRKKDSNEKKYQGVLAGV